MLRVFFFKRRCQEQEHKSERARIALSGQLSWMDQFNLDLDLAWTYPDRKIQAYWEHLRHSSVWPWLMFYLFSVAMQGMNTRSTVLYVVAIVIGNVQCLIDAIKMRSSIFLWVLFFRRVAFRKISIFDDLPKMRGRFEDDPLSDQHCAIRSTTDDEEVSTDGCMRRDHLWPLILDTHLFHSKPTQINIQYGTPCTRSASETAREVQDHQRSGSSQV